MHAQMKASSISNLSTLANFNKQKTANKHTNRTVSNVKELVLCPPIELCDKLLQDR